METKPSWPDRLVAEQARDRAEVSVSRAPDDPTAHFKLACCLDRLGQGEDAQRAYLDVLARDMAHGPAFRQLAALLERRGFLEAARTVLTQAVAANPSDGVAHAALGHLARDAGETENARLHYETALRLDPALPEAHQGMSYLLDGTDEAAAERHRATGFAGCVLTSLPYRGTAPPVTVLRLVSARGGNVPTRLLLDDTIFQTHTLVADQANPSITLPPHQIVFNAIGDAERCEAALAAAERLLARTSAPVFNPPARIRPTSRAANAARLAGLPGVVVARTATSSREALASGLPAGFAPPVLLRSPGYHTGQHFLRIETASELPAALAALPGTDLLNLIEPLDTRGPDGYWRKYRVMLVGDAILPLHLAIAPHWKVHHFTAGMQDRAEHRAEEAAFLANMQAVLAPPTIAALNRVAATLGLDYAGIDFALDDQGRVLLFEANATMTITLPVPGSIWEYRLPANRAVIDTMQAALCRAAG